MTHCPTSSRLAQGTSPVILDGHNNHATTRPYRERPQGTTGYVFILCLSKSPSDILNVISRRISLIDEPALTDHRVQEESLPVRSTQQKWAFDCSWTKNALKTRPLDRGGLASSSVAAVERTNDEVGWSKKPIQIKEAGPSKTETT